MKKVFSFIVALSLIAVCGTAYAAPNWGENDINRQLKDTFNKTDTTGLTLGNVNVTGLAVTNNVTATGVSATGDVTFRGALYADGRYGANSTVLFSSSTTFQQANLPYAYVMKAIGGAAGETSLLPTALPGQVVTFVVYGAQTNGTWILKPDAAATTPVKAVFTSITFNAVGQTATLKYLNDTLGWLLVSVDGSASGAAPTVVYPTVQ